MQAVARLLNRRCRCVNYARFPAVDRPREQSHVYRKMRATSMAGLLYAGEREKARTASVVEALRGARERRRRGRAQAWGERNL